MRAETITLVVPAAVGAGAPQRVDRFRERTIQTIGINGTLRLMGSMDNLNWSPLGDNIIADLIRAVPELVVWMRVDRTAGVSVSDEVLFMGMDSRTN